MGKYREADYYLSAYEKREIYKKIKSQDTESMTSMRKLNRKLRKMVKDGSIKEYCIEKPSKFIGREYNSSGIFKKAYNRQRMENEFYDVLRYADY